MLCLWLYRVLYQSRQLTVDKQLFISFSISLIWLMNTLHQDVVLFEETQQKHSKYKTLCTRHESVHKVLEEYKLCAKCLTFPSRVADVDMSQGYELKLNSS